MGQLPFKNISNTSKVLDASGDDATGANDGHDGDDGPMGASDDHGGDAMDASGVHGGDRGDDARICYQT